jgi:outer membrane protein TolC
VTTGCDHFENNGLISQKRLIFILVLIHFYLTGLFLSNQAYSAEAASTANGTDNRCIQLDLNRAIDIALDNNRSISTSHNAITSQKFSLEAAKADFDTLIVPSGRIGTSGGKTTDTDQEYFFQMQATRKFTSGTQVSLGPVITKAGDNYTTAVSVALTQPIARGLGESYNLDPVYSHNYSLRSSERSLYQTRVNTVLEVVAAYCDAVKQEESRSMYKALTERMKGHAEGASAKEEIGLATPIDTYRAVIRQKDAEDAVTQADTLLQEAKDRLKVVLALPMNLTLELTDREFPENPVGTLEEVLEAARLKRIDLEQLRDDLNELERKSELAKENILPDLNLVAGYSRFGEAERLSSRSTFDQDRWWLNLQGSTDLYRTSQRAAYEQSLLTIRNQRLAYADRREQVNREVRKQFTLLRELGKRIEIRKEQSRQAEGKLQLASIKFAYGMADNFDLIEAETEMQRARTDLLAARIDYVNAQYALRAATGTLLIR